MPDKAPKQNKPKKKRTTLTDDEIMEHINAKKTAEQIKAETGITLLTLQKRIGKLQQQHKKFYEVPGLFDEETETIKFGTAGIRIAKKKLETFGFHLEDQFTIQHDTKKNQIILTKQEATSSTKKPKSKKKAEQPAEPEQVEQEPQPQEQQV